MEPSKRLLTGEECPPACPQHPGPNVGTNPPCLLSAQRHTVLELEKIRRVALMVTPQASGEFLDQAWEALSTIRAVLRQQSEPMKVTVQTVFLRRVEDSVPCRRLFEAYYGDHMPVTNFVIQPPCGGEALAIEAWAVGGSAAEIQFHDPNTVSVAYDGLRWIHCGGVSPPPIAFTTYGQSGYAFERMGGLLAEVGASFGDVVRTWIYQGGITETEDGIERYRKLNRARADFFEDLQFGSRLTAPHNGRALFPASTGIGTFGRGLVTSCLALLTERKDVRLVPLENPLQTPSFEYEKRFSEKSPRFSRAMAVVIGDYLTTWISGTASIVGCESRHLDDIEGQTTQTIDNIEQLISRSNFARHGMSEMGADLSDLAKVRVYVKHPEHFEKCRAVCEERFGPLPTIYAVADVCRPELLVEIEGVAFSQIRAMKSEPPKSSAPCDSAS